MRRDPNENCYVQTSYRHVPRLSSSVSSVTLTGQGLGLGLGLGLGTSLFPVGAIEIKGTVR